MALAGDQHDVTGKGHGNGRGNCPAAIRYFLSAGRGREDGGADGRRVFTAGIIVGYNDDIGMGGRSLPHQGTLAGVTVAAGPKNDDQPARHMRAQRRTGCDDGIGCVGIIHINGST